MLITYNGMTEIDRGFNKWENEKYTFYWKGFIYTPGIPSGIETVREFAKYFNESQLKQQLVRLKGSFFMVIRVKEKHKFYCFVDNSGCYDAYFADDAISSSFLALAKYKRLSKEAMNREAIIEFLNFGNLFANKTFFDSIKKLDSNELLFFDNCSVKVVKKGIAPIYDETQPVVNFQEFFQLLAQSLRKQKVSVDLSGGIDSRLLGVLLHYYGVNFETTISGVEGIQDVEIPKEVADLFGNPLHVTFPFIENLENELDELFALSDGLHDILRHYRTLQHNKNRVKRGMNVAITGVGGELFKDFFWLQDFPFYCMKKVNLGRLFHTRMLSMKCQDHYFGNEYLFLNQNLQNRMLRELSPYVLETNTKTYDNIYYNYRMKTIAGKFITAANHVVPSYAPLLDVDLVRYGFHLKRRERLFNRFHRKVITNLNPEASRIRTTEGGISVSTDKLEVAKDFQKYVANYGKRFAKILGRKFLKKTYFQDSPEHPDLFATVRNLDRTGIAINLLKEEKILHHNLKMNQIHNQHLGTMISLAILITNLEQNKTQIPDHSACFLVKEYV